MPSHGRPRPWATLGTVPLPAKGSSTMSPGAEQARTIRSVSSSGKTAMWEVCSAEPNATRSTSQTLPGFLPQKLLRLSYSFERSRTSSTRKVGSAPGFTNHRMVSCLFVNFLVKACPPQ